MAQRYVNSKFEDLETIKLRHILFSRSWPVHFNSSEIHCPWFWVYYEVKRTVIKFWIC